MLLKDICVLDVACCTSDLSVLGAARMMRQQHTGDLIVVEETDGERTPIGILTDRDIVIEVIAQGLDPASVRVGEVMTKKLAIAGGSEDVSQALERMHAHGVRRIPIVDDAGALLGIVTLDDLLKLHVEEAGLLQQVIAKEQTHESRAKR